MATRMPGGCIRRQCKFAARQAQDAAGGRQSRAAGVVSSCRAQYARAHLHGRVLLARGQELGQLGVGQKVEAGEGHKRCGGTGVGQCSQKAHHCCVVGIGGRAGCRDSPAQLCAACTWTGAGSARGWRESRSGGRPGAWSLGSPPCSSASPPARPGPSAAWPAALHPQRRYQQPASA